MVQLEVIDPIVERWVCTSQSQGTPPVERLRDFKIPRQASSLGYLRAFPRARKSNGAGPLRLLQAHFGQADFAFEGRLPPTRLMSPPPGHQSVFYIPSVPQPTRSLTEEIRKLHDGISPLPSVNSSRPQRWGRSQHIHSVYRVPAYKLQLVRERTVPIHTRICTSPREAADLFRAYIGDSDREHVVAIFLDSQNRFIGLPTISVGTIEYCIVNPREVFKAALLCNATSLVLAHNHPSGDPAPSEDDIGLTRQLQEAAELLDIPMMDHIIIGESSYSSFYELGLLDQLADPPSPRKKRKRKT
ncbi:MAG TPA: JAB domain-containing protein [Longimicrobiaceae bacterium]|nr:JAB domain-containing protein [Longimicrobiaceae bacterium]